MPVTFDFDSPGGASHDIFSGTTHTNTHLDVSEGVKFTTSLMALNGTADIYHGNATVKSIPIMMNTRGGGNNTFLLQLNDVGKPSLTQFSGTAINQVVLKLGPYSNAGSWRVSFTNGGPATAAFQKAFVAGTMANASVAVAGQFTGIRFTTLSAGTDMISISRLTVNNVNCFVAGTMIATRAGAVAVEDLAPGMRILTADGTETAVRWLGTQPVNVRLSHPARINPICIRAGALADGVPARDLYVSQDHALCLDGLLINAGALVNGRTIFQVSKMPLDGFTYYHVETDAHELILAENTAAESFIDYADRDSFVNGDERDATPPIREMDLPRIAAARLVPDAIVQRLAGRAGRNVANRAA